MRVILPFKDNAAKSIATSAADNTPASTTNPTVVNSKKQTKTVGAEKANNNTSLNTTKSTSSSFSKSTGSDRRNASFGVKDGSGEAERAFVGSGVATSSVIASSASVTTEGRKRKAATVPSEKLGTGANSGGDIKLGPVAKPSKVARHQKLVHNTSSFAFGGAIKSGTSDVTTGSLCFGSKAKKLPEAGQHFQSISSFSGHNHKGSKKSSTSFSASKMVSNSDKKLPLQKRRGGNNADLSSSPPGAMLRTGAERYEYNPERNVNVAAFLNDDGVEDLAGIDQANAVVDENEPTLSYNNSRFTKDVPSSLPNQPRSAASHGGPAGTRAAVGHNACNTIEGTNNSGLNDGGAFRETLKTTLGLDLVEQEGDGNCLFRAVALQIFGDANMHGEIRRRCMDFMAKDEAHYAQFITEEPFHDYIQRKREDGVHGNHIEIQAISELYNRPVEVFVPDNGPKPINIHHGEYKTEDVPIRLSYHDGNHYNAVIDPLCPTAGLGLGLPGLQPGLADEMQLKEACKESDRLAFVKDVEKAVEESDKVQVQRVMRESEGSIDHFYKQKALALSDLEATDFELEQAVLNSSLETYNNSKQSKKQSGASRGTGNGRPDREVDHFGMGSIGVQSGVSSYDQSSYWTSAAATGSTSSLAAAAGSTEDLSPTRPQEGDEYPQTVQELVMNGFPLGKVVKAYELIGDNFDDLLAFLMSTGGGT